MGGPWSPLGAPKKPPVTRSGSCLRQLCGRLTLPPCPPVERLAAFTRFNLEFCHVEPLVIKVTYRILGMLAGYLATRGTLDAQGQSTVMHASRLQCRTMHTGHVHECFNSFNNRGPHAVTLANRQPRLPGRVAVFYTTVLQSPPARATECHRSSMADHIISFTHLHPSLMNTYTVVQSSTSAPAVHLVDQLLAGAASAWLI